MTQSKLRAIGIDPGTKSFDLVGLEDGRLFLDLSIPSMEISAEPQRLIDVLQAAMPVDLIVGPSGYGLPWIAAHDLSTADVKLLVLSAEQDRGRDTTLGGMHEMIRLLAATDFPVVFVPAVIHLSSVPAHRKVNRIDMGTADKLCAVALGIHDQAQRLHLPYGAASFIYVELGGAFTAVIAVDQGKIVDGLGGTSGPLGYLASGAMDGETAYLLGSFPKEWLCSGGLSYIAGHPEWEPERILARIPTDTRCELAWQAFLESLIKAVAAEMSVVPSPREILLSGRLCRTQEIYRQVADRLARFAPVRKVEGFAPVAKEAAQGAVLIADGLAGGKHERLIESMELRSAMGTCLDYLYMDGAENLRHQILR